jgi:hypothetical protein
MGRRKRDAVTDEARRFTQRLAEVGLSMRGLHQKVRQVPTLGSPETVRKIVRGDLSPTDAQRAALADALGVEPVWLRSGLTQAEIAERYQTGTLPAPLARSLFADPADLHVADSVPEPRRSAVLRFGQFLQAIPPRETSRGPRRTQLVHPFRHAGDRRRVLQRAATYLAAAECTAVVVPRDFAYVLWSDLVLHTFALTLQLDAPDGGGLEILRSTTLAEESHP